MVRFAGAAEDLDDVEEVTATLGDDASIAAAARGRPRWSCTAPRGSRAAARAPTSSATTSTGTTHLLTAARAAGVERFVHVSSIASTACPPARDRSRGRVGYDPHPDAARRLHLVEARGGPSGARVRTPDGAPRRGDPSRDPRRPRRAAASRRDCRSDASGPCADRGAPATRLPLCHVDDAAHAIGARGDAPPTRAAPTTSSTRRSRRTSGSSSVPRGVPSAGRSTSRRGSPRSRRSGLELVARLDGARRRRSRATGSAARPRTSATTRRVLGTDLGWRPEIGVGRSARAWHGPRRRSTSPPPGRRRRSRREERRERT